MFHAGRKPAFTEEGNHGVRARLAVRLQGVSDQGRSPVLMIFVISAAIAGILALAGWWMHGRLTTPPVRSPMSSEAQEYLQQIAVTDARMSAADTPLGTAVTYLDAQIANKGSQTVRELDLRLEFVDLAGQMVLRQTAHPVTNHTPGLKPGEVRNLHITFDHMPAEWNQAPPAFTPVYVSF
jgi:hypothetical protein